MKRTRGFSLTEVLVVIAIITLLAALLFPVFSRAKASSFEVPCTSNLRQLGTAWQLYLEANNDTGPPQIAHLLVTNSQINPVLTCPADRWKGANDDASEKTKRPVSYFMIPPMDDFRQAILAADPNHGIFYCIVHGKSKYNRTPQSTSELEGTVLRLRRDLSVQRATVTARCTPNTSQGRIEGRSDWSLLTDVPCAEPFCMGLTEPCGN